MKPKICIPIIDTTVTKAIESIAIEQKNCDMIEIRADYIEDLTKDNIASFLSSCEVPAIFTCRHPNEGGKWNKTETHRLEMLQKAIDIGFPYVDIELETIKSATFVIKSSTEIIISYHNFSETPSYPELEKTIQEISVYKPSLYKIATQVNNSTDANLLFKLLINHGDKKMIVAGMGKEGVLVRILAPYLGSFCTFAAGRKGISAPGQMSNKELQSIYKLIQNTI